MPNPNACHNAPPTSSHYKRRVSLAVQIGLLTLGITTTLSTFADTPVKQGLLEAGQTDWQPRELLTKEQLAALKPACEGAYIDPFANQPKPDPANTLIAIDAGTADMNPEYIELGDGVIVQQGPRLIKAGHMVFDKASESAELSDGVQIRQQGSLIHGETAKVNMTANEAEFTEGSFLAHQSHMRGTAGRLAHEPNGRLVLEDGTFTSCAPGDNAWLMSGDKIVIDPESRQGSGKNVVVRVAGVPVLYTPYIRFPVGSERQTGILTPSIGTVNGGVDFALPWYWNIAPNQDATITPRYVGYRGAMLEGEYRRLGLISNNQLRGSFLPSDAGGNPSDKAEEEILGIDTHEGENRWLAQWWHQGGLRKPWYSEVEYGEVGDIDFLRDLPAASFSLANETFLTQSATFGYDITNWHLAAHVYNAQNLLTDVNDSYRRLPQIKAHGNYRLGDFGASLYNEYVHFDHSQAERIDGSTILTGERARIDYQLHYLRSTSWGFIKPSIGAEGVAYQLEEDQLSAGASDTPALSTHYASIDGGLVFEQGDGQQTLEPRLFYLFRQYTDHDKLFNVTDDGQDVNFDTSPLTFGYHQLFRKRRFTGGDRLEDANQLTVGLTHKYYRDNGKPLWNISLGQLFYFGDREVGLTRASETSEESDIAGQFGISVTDHLSSLGSAQYNPKTKKLMRANFGLHYAKNNWLFNIDYHYAREQIIAAGDLSQRIDQLDLSFYVPTGNQWRLVGRSFYDLDESRELESFVGFEYDSCCYRLRAVARRWLDAKLALAADSSRKPYDQGIMFEVELLGLGSSSQRIANLLKDSIFGFTQDNE